MTSIEEINGISATAVYRVLGYSSDQRGIENSILYGVMEVLKDLDLDINYSESYFFEEFWFYFITAADVNAQYPIIEFCMANQLSPEELRQTDARSVYETMRDLAFALPRDRAKVVGISFEMNEPNQEFQEKYNSRFDEYTLLAKNAFSEKNSPNDNNAWEKLMETYVYYLSSSVGVNGNSFVEMAFRHVILSKLKIFNSELKDFVLDKLKYT